MKCEYRIRLASEGLMRAVLMTRGLALLLLSYSNGSMEWILETCNSVSFDFEHAKSAEKEK